MSEAVTINVTDNTETITFAIVEAGESITLTVNEAARGPAGPAGTDGSFPGFGTSGTTACVGNDTRLSDARTPSSTLAHKSSHGTGQPDALAPADIGAATTAQGSLATTAIQPDLHARLTIGAGTSAVTYAAKVVGQPGNLISVAHAAAADAGAIAVSVVGSAITVTPPTYANLPIVSVEVADTLTRTQLAAWGNAAWIANGANVSYVGPGEAALTGFSGSWSFRINIDYGYTAFTSTKAVSNPALILASDWVLTTVGGNAWQAPTISAATGSTSDQIAAAVTAREDASALVTATGAGTGVAATQTATNLTGGSFLHAASHNEGGSDPITQLNLSGGLTTAAITFSGTAAATTRANLGAAPVAAARHVFWPAGAAIPQSATAPEASVIDSGDQDVFMDAFGFDSATSEWVQFVGYLEHWGAGTIKCKAAWTYAGAPNPATNVQWGFQARAFANDDAHNQAFGTAQVISDAPISAGDCHITAMTPAITVGGTPANGRRLQLKVYRDVANDDMAADAKLIGVWIEYTEATAEEAAWA